MATKKKKKKKKSKDKVFNDRPRKIFRHYFGASEFAFSIFFVFFTLAMGYWFVAQKENYDPGERDIDPSVLIAQSVEDHLWEPPLQLWAEPGSMAAMGGGGGIDLGIFPPQMLGGGWAPGSRVEVFDWDNLYEKIDGQETQYKAYGFEALHFLSIEDREKELEVNVELYDMGEFSNALGVFAAQRNPDAELLQAGDAYYYLTEAGGMGIVGQYYFKFSGNTESETIQNHAVLVMKSFADGLGEGGALPKALTILSKDLHVEFQDIEYVKADVFQYDFAKDFWFGGYGDGDPKARFYLHEAASEEAAASLFDQIVEEHSWEYEEISRDGNNVVFKHEFLETFTTVNQSGVFVYGVDGAADAGGATSSVEDLAATLFEDAA